MRAIASELGIRAPSLYKHISEKREVEIALVAEALEHQAEMFEKVLANSESHHFQYCGWNATWARDHPNLYSLMNDQPLPRDELPQGLEERAVLPLLEALGGDMNRARAAWAFAHGMVTLELADRFPEHADSAAAWSVGLEGIAITTRQLDQQGEISP